MENVKLVEKVILVPKKPSKRERIFLSNIDLSLVSYQESVSFFDPPKNGMSFSEACDRFYYALGKMLVPYAFVAGRLVPTMEEDSHHHHQYPRLEIECNDAGIVVAIAKTECKLEQLGDLMVPKSEFRQFIAFLHEENEEKNDVRFKPLMFLQLTQLGCGSLSLASRFNHCILDGIGVNDFERNLAALTRGEKELVTFPNPDRTVFKARNPPQVNHPHLEYSKVLIHDGTNNNNNNDDDNTFTVRGISIDAIPRRPQQINTNNRTHSIYLSPKWIAIAKKMALEDKKLKYCTTFQVVAARVWKARSLAIESKLKTETSTMLFPVDIRKLVVPQVPCGFAGNALVPGFVRATLSELKEKEDSFLVRKVQEGIERLTDEYVKSGIDWLEVNRGVPCREDSFSLVAWWRLGLEEEEFVWGKLKCAAPVFLKPGLVILLPGLENQGGLHVCLELSEDQENVFSKVLLMMMDN